MPNHSTFSKTRVRKWNESDFFQQVFLEIVRRCIEQELIDGKEMTSDGSYIPTEVSRNSWIDVELEVEQSMLSYFDDLDQELASQPGFKPPNTHNHKEDHNKQNRSILSVAISITGANEVWDTSWK